MRMQFYGKSSSNLVAGVLMIFSLIVLYNYWNVSTFNKDLAFKLHTLEQQSISISRANSALQSNLEQTQEEKTNLQLSLQKEQGEEKVIKGQVSEKEKVLKKFQNELDNTRKEVQSLKTQKAELESQINSKDSEINRLKEKVVSLQAQIAEKNGANDELKKSLEKVEKQLKGAGSMSSTTAAGVKTQNNKVDDSEPVLLSDPAVPYPDGWMSSNYPRKAPKVSVLRSEMTGIVGHNSPVIVFDPPNSKPKKARFSVVDPPNTDSVFYRSQKFPPEQQMGPEAEAPAPLKAPEKKDESNGVGVGPAPVGAGEDENNGGEAAGAGVLPVPGGGGNLDAAEDDGDHPLKEAQDDQSPDGVLSAKELVGVGPAPPAKNDKNEAEVGHQSGQDIREAAHLGSDLLNHNQL